MPAGKERPQERYVRELLAGRFGVLLRRRPDQNEMRLRETGRKSADYELVNAGVRQAVVEVKALTRAPRTAENGWDVEVLWEYGGGLVVAGQPTRQRSFTCSGCHPIGSGAVEGLSRSLEFW